MKNIGLLIGLLASFAVYTVLWIVTYRSASTDKPLEPKLLRTPIETTIEEQRARGESSFIIAKGPRQWLITRAAFIVLVLFGYVAIAVAWAIAFWNFFHSAPT
jgi:ABC-type Na+ efflux pump permease subunit